MQSVRKLVALTIWALVAIALGTPAQTVESRPQKTLVFILAENEYQAWRTIPEFGQMLEDRYGFQCEYLTSSTDDKDPNRFFIPRMERVKKADLVVVFAPRRALPSEQMQILKDYLDSGNP